VLHSLRYGVFDGLDLAEQLMWSVVVKRKLAIQHRVQQHAKRPHITWLALVQPTCTI